PRKTDDALGRLPSREVADLAGGGGRGAPPRGGGGDFSAPALVGGLPGGGAGGGGAPPPGGGGAGCPPPGGSGCYFEPPGLLSALPALSTTLRRKSYCVWTSRSAISIAESMTSWRLEVPSPCRGSD